MNYGKLISIKEENDKLIIIETNKYKIYFEDSFDHKSECSFNIANSLVKDNIFFKDNIYLGEISLIRKDYDKEENSKEFLPIFYMESLLDEKGYISSCCMISLLFLEDNIYDENITLSKLYRLVINTNNETENIPIKIKMEFM